MRSSVKSRCARSDRSAVPLSYFPLSPWLPNGQAHPWYYRLPRCLADEQKMQDVEGDLVDATK